MSNRYPLRNIPVRARDYTHQSVIHIDLLNQWLPPSPVTSPDELVIQQRSRRRSPTKNAARLTAATDITDFQSFASPLTSHVTLTPDTDSSGTRYPGIDGIKKRLLMTPESMSQTPLAKTLEPPFKKTRRSDSSLLFKERMRLELSALSNQQLVDIISNVAEKYSMHQEIQSSLPPPDVRPLIRNLEFFCGNILRSIPSSRLVKDIGCFSRVKSHIENFKLACINQGRQLQQCGVWSALSDYACRAWTIVEKLPIWTHGNQNKARLACQRSLVNFIKMAAKSGTLNKTEVDNLIQWCEERQTEFPPLRTCVQALKNQLSSCSQNTDRKTVTSGKYCSPKKQT